MIRNRRNFSPLNPARELRRKSQAVGKSTSGQVRLVIPELGNMQIWIDPGKDPEVVKQRYIDKHRSTLKTYSLAEVMFRL